ncbi:MAG: RHS repeat-associated core domain-containing protein [Bacteroidota bacterium]
MNTYRSIYYWLRSCYLEMVPLLGVITNRPCTQEHRSATVAHSGKQGYAQLVWTALLVTGILAGSATSSHAQFELPDLGGNVSITGPTVATQNSTQTYNLSSDEIITSTTWSAFGGQIISSTNFSVTVRWTSVGTGSVSASVNTWLNTYFTSLSVLVNSSTPAQPSTPTVLSSSCGHTTLRRGTPPSGVTWYWQSSSSGTATSNSGTDYTVNNSGWVYLRARNSAGEWSTGSASLNVSVIQNPAMPPTPSQNASCGNTTLTRGAPPIGETWYWQTSSGGTSTGNNSSTYTMGNSGTVYLRSRHDLSGCWSSARTVNVTVTQAVVPNTPSQTQSCGQTVLTWAGTPPAGASWYWQTSSTGTSTAHSGSTYTATSSGTVYLRSRTYGPVCWSTAVAIPVSVNPGAATPQIIDIDYTLDGPVLTRNNPPSGQVFYWQGTNPNGTDTGGSELTYSIVNPGTYYIRGRNNNGCWGNSTSFNYAGIAQTPSAVTADAHQPGQVTLGWHGAGNETRFIVYRATSAAGPFQPIANLSSATIAYVDNNVDYSITYYYRIQAEVGAERSIGSAPVLVTPPAPAGLSTELVHEPQYNGNISAIKWKNYAGKEEKLYTYRYDAMNRITDANYAQGTTTNGLWTTTAARGGFNVESISYDLNGNIKTMNRQALAEDLKKIDEMQYSYLGNQLTKVNDNATEGGFKDGDNTNDDYDYDDNGNITFDRNKGIDMVEYNILNLPKRVVKDDGQYLTYTYDAIGSKLSQQVYDANDQLQKQTEYMGEFIYEDGQLQIIQHEEGRIVPDDGHYEYQYHLRDHLGNVRTTFTTEPETITYLATMEYGNAQEEETLFSGVAETRGTQPLASQSPDKVAILNANQPVGPSISLQVGAGDVLNIETYAYFESGSGFSNPIDQIAFISSVAGVFGGVNGGTEGQQQLFDAFNELLTGTITGSDDDNVPAAGITYLLFDQNMVWQDAGYIPVTDQAEEAKELLKFDPVIVQEAGYLYFYVSNESQTLLRTFFDDIKVVHEHSPVVQVDDYYPFGLTYNGYQRADNTLNNFLFNGKEVQSDLGLGWTDFHARQYDASIGRMLSIDPLSELVLDWTPYRFGFNNPIRYSDPTGLMEVDENGNVTYNTAEEISDFFTGFNERYGNSGGGDCEDDDCEEAKRKRRYEAHDAGFFSKEWWQWLLSDEGIEYAVNFLHQSEGSGTLSEDASTLEKVDDMVKVYLGGKIIKFIRIPGFKGKVKAIKKGQDVSVKSYKEAQEVLFEAFPNAVKTKGSGPRSQEATSRLKKSFKKQPTGSYHMDYKFNDKDVLYGHEELPDFHPHKTTPHINYMTPGGKKGTIFIILPKN